MLTNWEIIQILTIIFSTIIPLLVLFFTIRYYKKNDKIKEKIQKIETILIIQNNIFIKFGEFYQKWFSFKGKYYEAYLKRDINTFKNEFENIKRDIYYMDSELNVKYLLYLKDIFNEYEKFNKPISLIIYNLSNIIEMPIWGYWDYQIKEYKWTLTDKDKKVYIEDIEKNPYIKIDKEYKNLLNQIVIIDEILKNKWLELFHK